jgi:hypothetical protein
MESLSYSFHERVKCVEGTQVTVKCTQCSYFPAFFLHFPSPCPDAGKPHPRGNKDGAPESCAGPQFNGRPAFACGSWLSLSTPLSGGQLLSRKSSFVVVEAYLKIGQIVRDKMGYFLPSSLSLSCTSMSSRVSYIQIEWFGCRSGHTKKPKVSHMLSTVSDRRHSCLRTDNLKPCLGNNGVPCEKSRQLCPEHLYAGGSHRPPVF